MPATPTPFSARGLRSWIRAGVSSLLRLGRARLLLPVVLFCSMCLALGACRGSLDGDPQAETNPQPKPEALAGLLSKPVLPELQVACGERSVAGVRAGYTWTLDGNVKQLDEVWPPPGRSGSLLVSPGEDVSFVITVPPDSPAASTATESVIARLDMWDLFYANDPAGADLLYSSDCEMKGSKAQTVRFAWRVPEDLARQPDTNSFIVRLTVGWGDAAGSASGAPWVSFYWNLVVVEKDARDAALKTARRYFDAVWDGDEEALSEVAPRWLANEPEGVPPTSPLRALLPGPREPVFWKSPSQTFRLASRPSFVVDDVHPSASGPYAQCLVEYEVDVRDVQPGKTERQAMSERVYLLKDDYGSWMVSSAHRTPSPATSQDGGGSGVSGANAHLPSVTVRDEEFGAVVQAGPFGNAQHHSGQKWSDDGEWFAFAGTAGGANGIWAASRDGSKLANLVALEGTAVQLLDWAPGQHRIRFLAYGYHSCGPHADKTGFWLGEVDLDTREVGDIAFIRYPTVAYLRDLRIPEGRRYLVFRHTPDLWRIDMETGEALKLAGDVPSWDGLLVLRYSPSGWFAAYGEPFGSSQPGFTVYDIEAGEKRSASLSDVRASQAWAHFEGWTPTGELMALVCRAGEVNSGEDSSEPAGSTAIRLYSPAGALLKEIIPPEGDNDDRFGSVVWNADGSALAVAVGCLTDPISSPLGFMEIPHQARAIYVWTRADGTLRKVADISGSIESLSWAEDGRAIQAWLRVPDDQEVEVQSGVRAYLDGTQIEVKRAAGSWPAQQGSIFYAALGDWALVERYGPGGASLVAAKATPGGPEIVVTDIGLLYLDEPVMTPDAFAISGEVPDQYGRGDHWVYLVVRRE